ncbi:unnamed protein product [Thelazia callipaeda]|uniref:Apple domain-containing protein n=1 Tax=Thelazia callipaeda TaxID=103827 RepID=A0A0N5CMB2_THECL|nr:unnamed protein product [Thelazia callipaeda]
MRAVSFLLTVMGVLVNLVQTYNRPNHFGNPCVLCKCFVMYTDRDKPLSSVPYGVAKDGYDSTEDQCLSTCLKDNKCKGVVYGLVGGRNVFTCELYADAALDELIYVPHVNIYLPKRRSECHVYCKFIFYKYNDHFSYIIYNDDRLIWNT